MFTIYAQLPELIFFIMSISLKNSHLRAAVASPVNTGMIEGKCILSEFDAVIFYIIGYMYIHFKSLTATTRCLLGSSSRSADGESRRDLSNPLKTSPKLPSPSCPNTMIS